MSEQPDKNAPAAAAPKSAGAPIVLWIGVAAGALAVGAAAGALVVGPKVVAMRRIPATAVAAAAEDKGGKGKGDKKDETLPLFRVDNVIVNPAGSQGSRFLLCSVAVELPDSKTQDRFRAREAEVRDVVITTVQRHTLEQLAEPGARDTLKRDLATALQPLAGRGTLHIFLPQFVIQ